MRYSIIILPKAEKFLSALPETLRDHLRFAIDALAENPRPFGARKLSGEKDIWRIRAGVYRILYSIKDKELLITIVKVGHRKDVYR